MTTYVPPKKNGAGGWIGWVSLAPRTATGAFQSNPTLATGDVKVSIDGGALANLGTLPAVTPASSKLVKITLSQAEVNGDNIIIIFSDAAGAEWCDKTICLQTVANQNDDLSTQTSVNTIDGIVDDILLDTAEIGTAGAGLTNINLPNQTMDIVGNITGNLSGSVGSVTGLTASNLDATISSRASAADMATALGYIDTEVAAILADTNELQTDWADGGRLDLILDARASQTSVDDLPTNAELATALAAADDAVLAAIAALENLSAAQVNAEVVDALSVDTYAEPAQGAPGATISLAAKLGWLYKFLRNKKTITATTFSLFNDDAATVDTKSTISDDGTTYTETEKTSGP